MVGYKQPLQIPCAAILRANQGNSRTHSGAQILPIINLWREELQNSLFFFQLHRENVA